MAALPQRLLSALRSEIDFNELQTRFETLYPLLHGADLHGLLTLPVVTPPPQNTTLWPWNLLLDHNAIIVVDQHCNSDVEWKS